MKCCYGCKGSEKNDDSIKLCALITKVKTNNCTYICPCIDCLIKGMCKARCPEFQSYAAYYYSYKERDYWFDQFRVTNLD